MAQLLVDFDLLCTMALFGILAFGGDWAMAVAGGEA
jgi:hypothetical protein